MQQRHQAVSRISCSGSLATALSLSDIYVCILSGSWVFWQIGYGYSWIYLFGLYLSFSLSLSLSVWRIASLTKSGCYHWYIRAPVCIRILNRYLKILYISLCDQSNNYNHDNMGRKHVLDKAWLSASSLSALQSLYTIVLLILRLVVVVSPRHFTIQNYIARGVLQRRRARVCNYRVSRNKQTQFG